MPPAPIVVHRVSPTGVRRVPARGDVLGLAHSDADAAGFLRGVGVERAEELLDAVRWVEWRGGRAHEYSAE
ncbi:hypothetical protein [Streptomyces sp. G45]|uniref:hypothetical protein n=1 Tax=Streptomyces sp. G45 TaxID=3406627 RepID=UPI003C24FBC1